MLDHATPGLKYLDVLLADIGYAVINPVVIVCIRRDDRILLARSPRFLPAVNGLIAGFVPGRGDP